jgi:hypothetical protein
MGQEDLLSRALDKDIAAANRRLVKAIERRLPSMGLEQKERYFALLSKLVGKLEGSDKSLRDVLQEMMVEAAPIIMQELNAR